MATKFVILYTHQKTKKRKTWHDGTLAISKDGKSGLLKNDANETIDSVRIKSEISVGDDLESAKYLIQIDDICTSNSTEKKDNLSAQFSEDLGNKNLPCSQEKKPAFRSKLPKFPKSSMNRNCKSSSLNSEGKGNRMLGATKDAALSQNLNNHEAKEENESSEALTNPPAMKKRKKFAVPRKIGPQSSDLDPVIDWNKNPPGGDEFSDMVCTVVRQNAVGIWQTVEHNQPKYLNTITVKQNIQPLGGRKGSDKQNAVDYTQPLGGSSGHEHQTSKLRKLNPNCDSKSKKVTPRIDTEGDDQSKCSVRSSRIPDINSISKKLRGGRDYVEEDSSESSIKMSTMVSKDSVSTKPTTSRNQQPTRTAKEVLEIIKRVKEKAKKAGNQATNIVSHDTGQVSRNSTGNQLEENDKRDSVQTKTEESSLIVSNEKGGTDAVMHDGSNAQLKSKHIKETSETVKSKRLQNDPLCGEMFDSLDQENTPPDRSDLLVEKGSSLFRINEDYDDFGQDFTPNFMLGFEI